MSILSQILDHKIIAIIRGAKPADVVKIAEALYDGGIRIVEITMNSEDPLISIRKVVDKLGHKMVIGAGTVLDAESGNKAITAGAAFILSPIADSSIIKAAKNLGVVSIPGAFSATEIYNAHKNGADLVKVFPAISPSYIKDIAGPFPQIPLLPTGGISLENIVAYKKAGAAGFGVGSSLVDTRQEITAQYFFQLTAKARKFVDSIAST